MEEVISHVDEILSADSLSNASRRSRSQFIPDIHEGPRARGIEALAQVDEQFSADFPSNASRQSRSQFIPDIHEGPRARGVAALAQVDERFSACVSSSASDRLLSHANRARGVAPPAESVQAMFPFNDACSRRFQPSRSHNYDCWSESGGSFCPSESTFLGNNLSWPVGLTESIFSDVEISEFQSDENMVWNEVAEEFTQSVSIPQHFSNPNGDTDLLPIPAPPASPKMEADVQAPRSTEPPPIMELVNIQTPEISMPSSMVGVGYKCPIFEKAKKAKVGRLNKGPALSPDCEAAIFDDYDTLL